MTRSDFSSERLTRAKALFESALALDAAARVALLERESGDDPELRDYVLQLLCSYDSGDDSFLTPGDSRESDATFRASYTGPKHGTQIGSYEIRQKLGQGGMGSVYEGWDSLLQRPVAIKFVAEQFAHSAQARQRFLREARSASKLSHPGIAAVYAAGEHGQQLYIAFKLVDGSTVADRLQENRLDLPDALRLIREAAEALGHAHDAGVLHRDVTSRNLMIDRDGSAVIVDFGLALPEMDSRITQPGSTFGTLAYMAPEVVQGKPHDRRSDLYGLGVVLYEMLTGELPFRTERSESLLYAIVNEPLQPASKKRPELPADVDRVLGKLLARDPQHRYQSSAELVEDLLLLEQGLKLKAKLPRRKHWPLLVAAVAIVALASAVYLRRVSTKAPRTAVQTEPIKMAVLPLQNNSVDLQGTEHLATGLGEDLAIKLGRIRSLRVTPWVSSQYFPMSNQTPLQDVAEDLGVDQLVVGTFRKQGEQIQVKLSYVEGSTGLMNWAEEYEGTENELLEIVNRIASSVVSRSGIVVDAADELALSSKPTENVEAYKLYLRGTQALRQETEASVGKAEGLFESALALDENMAAAHVGLATVYTIRRWYNWPDGPDGVTRAATAYHRALELDPGLWSARRGLARIGLYQGKSEDGLRSTVLPSEFSSGEIEPMLLRGEAAALAGLFDVAVATLDQVILADPSHPPAWHLRSFALLNRRETLPQAIAGAEEAMRRFGEDGFYYHWIATACHAMGRVEEARIAYTRELELSADRVYWENLFYLAILEFESNNDEAARVALRRLQFIMNRRGQANPRDVECGLAATDLLLGDPTAYERLRTRSDVAVNYGHEMLVIACAHLGRNREALEFLEDELDAGKLDFNELCHFLPSLQALQQEPGFQAYRARRQKILDGLTARYFPEFIGVSQ